MKFKNALKIKVSMLAVLALTFTACKNDDPKPPNEQELITTVKLTFTNTSNASDKVEATWRDIDGEGGNDPKIDKLSLKAESTYNVTVTFWDETKKPAEDVTKEIKAEDDEHQVFYIAEGFEITYVYSDKDANKKPLGLKGKVTTKAAGSGKLRIVLRHKLEKGALGVSEGKIANAKGDTDIDVKFDVTIRAKV